MVLSLGEQRALPRHLNRGLSPAPYMESMRVAEKLYTTKEIADTFRVSVYTVRIWAARGLPGAMKIGKSWRFTNETVDYLKFAGVV